MNKYKYGLLVTVITGALSGVGQRADACCTPPDIAISNWLLWVVPNHELPIAAWEYSCVCLWDWWWEFPSGVIQTDEYWESIPWYCESIYTGCFEFSSVGEYDNITAWASSCCDPNIKDSDYARVYVVDMGFSVSSYLIPVNDDDDDANGRMDHDNDGPPPSNDNDLVPVSISVDSPRTSPDRVQLHVIHDTGALQVWEYDPNMICLINSTTDPNEMWFPSRNWSKIVYAEGKRASSGQELYDPKLCWYYYGYDYYPAPYPHSLYGWTGETQSEKWLTVVHVDMDMDDVIDDHYSNPGITEETTPGGFIPFQGFKGLTVRPVNPNTVEDENPLTWPEVTVSVEYSGDGEIRLWNSAKTQEISLPYTFDCTEPNNFYIEGHEPSSDPCDITLVLTHGETGFQDRINLTVVEVDLDIVGVADPNEEDPGGLIACNDDDDNENEIPDNNDDPPIANENDLVKLELRLLPESLPVNAFHRVRLEALQGGGLIKTYHYSDKSGTPMGPLPFYFVSREALADGIWVEGFVGSSSLRDVELKMTYEYDERDVADDRVRLTVIELDITSVVPEVGVASGNRFCFDANRPGVCSFRAYGTTGLGSEWDAGLQWSLTAIAGSTLTTTPSETGPQVTTFTYTTLPNDNSEFGKKMLTLTHPSFPFVEEKQVEIYYPFGATNWPGATPAPPPPPYTNPPHWNFTWKNWYYYYRQTDADRGCTYHYSSSTCNPEDFPDYTPKVGGIENPKPMPVYADPRSGVSIKNSGDTLWGIDCFAYASRHEFKHHVDYSGWWGTMGGWDPNFDSDPRPAGGSGDYLIDADEESGFAPCDGGPYYWWTAVTHSTAPPAWGWDDQFECLFSQETYGPPDQHKDIDWAYPGSRWH